MKKLIQALAKTSAPRKRASVFELTSSDADLVTDQEKDILDDVAEGKDPFWEQKKRKEKEDPFNEGPVDLHFSSVEEQALRRQVKVHAQYEIDPEFGRKHPRTHKLLKSVHRALQDSKDLYQSLPDDPMGNIPTPPEDPVLYKFQGAYRTLQESMKQLRDHYREYGKIPKKWVSTVHKNFKDFLPLYSKIQETKKKVSK